MNRVPLDRRHFLSAALSTALAGLAGCATPGQRSATAAERIPFRTAAASRVDEKGDMRIAWRADGARRVTVFASERPDAGTAGQAVGSGTATGDILASGLPPGRRHYFTLVPDRGAPLVVADRALHLPTIPNLRDIGGYRTSDGRWVKMGLLYRSDQLDRISAPDMTALERLGLELVVDLRTQSERSREPDRLPPGSEPLVLDVAADSEGSLGGDMRKAMAAIASGKGAELLTDANRDFVSLGSARRAYAALLGRLGATQPKPLLYHCTAGKDRTGWASAVILTMLGVPRDTVMADYLASNAFLRNKNDATIKALAQSGSAISADALMPVLTVRAEYLEAAFDEVERRYGSFDAYLDLGLGLRPGDREALRDRYLSGQPYGPE